MFLNGGELFAKLGGNWTPWLQEPLPAEIFYQQK